MRQRKIATSVVFVGLGKIGSDAQRSRRSSLVVDQGVMIARLGGIGVTKWQGRDKRVVVRK